MPIPNIIERMRRQKCVYWAPEVVNYNGKATFAAPVELKCRWVEKREMFLDRQGNTQVSRAKVRFAETDLQELGVLWLGLLTEIAPGSITDPFLNENAWEIRKFEKIPNRWATDYLRIALL